jgi:hypothetical protein
MKEEPMTTNHRFSLNEARYVIDVQNPANDGKGYCHHGDPEDDVYLRERVLQVRLGEVLSALIIPTEPMKKDLFGKEYQPFNEEEHSIWLALLGAIKASHLNSLAPLLSTQHKFDGKLKREKRGILLRDIYGEFDSQAIDRARNAVFVIVEQFTKYLRNDLWKEHRDAEKVDYVWGIGLPEGYGISGSDHARANKAANDLALRARAVRANPISFSKYTVEFVMALDEHWPRLDCLDNEIDRGYRCASALSPAMSQAEVVARRLGKTFAEFNAALPDLVARGFHRQIRQGDIYGRNYFARCPGSDVWVLFDDLPKAARDRLWSRIEAGDFDIRT